jgi:hypothetical protein
MQWIKTLSLLFKELFLLVRATFEVLIILLLGHVKMGTPDFSSGGSREAADDTEGTEEEEELQYM